MPRTNQQPLYLLGLVIVWLALITFDFTLAPTPLNASYAWVTLLCIPGAAVFGWPVGLWLWRRTKLETNPVERIPLYALAVLVWLFASVTVLAYLRHWLTR